MNQKAVIFNDESFLHSQEPSCDLCRFLASIARGLAALLSQDVILMEIRSVREFYQIISGSGLSLYDLILTLSKSNEYRDEARLLLQMTVRAPLLNGLPNDINDAFWGLEYAPEQDLSGDALVLCALLEGVAVSLPTATAWETNSLLVKLQLLTPDEELLTYSVQVEHLSREEHSIHLIENSKQRLFTDIVQPEQAWLHREKIFPSLLFSSDLEQHMADVQVGEFLPILRRLKELDNAAGSWLGSDEKWPIFPCKVTGESKSTMSNDKLRKLRAFRSSLTGAVEIFEQHARIGGNTRIHMRIDVASKTIEIGYLGPHLPTSGS
ncbi:MAG: hypothetical protein P1V21_00790 [Rhizobiaceae bacterium]|nr:hypothetical protein [Rhizobiaceae bacterium]